MRPAGGSARVLRGIGSRIGSRIAETPWSQLARSNASALSRILGNALASYVPRAGCLARRPDGRRRAGAVLAATARRSSSAPRRRTWRRRALSEEPLAPLSRPERRKSLGSREGVERALECHPCPPTERCRGGGQALNPCVRRRLDVWAGRRRLHHGKVIRVRLQRWNAAGARPGAPLLTALRSR
jgi:hypothetical protein